MTAKVFASLVGHAGVGHDRPVKLVVLQACDETANAFGVMSETLLAEGVGAVCSTRRLIGSDQEKFLANLYGAVVAGGSAEGLESAVGQSGVRVVAKDKRTAIFPVDEEIKAWGGGEAVSASLPEEPAARVRTVVDEEAERCKRELEQKRAVEAFDVFLCHNSADKPAVRQMGTALKAKGLLPWLDVWELPPGQMWQPLLERQIDRIRAAALFVGAAGMGPWQTQEMYGLLRAFVDRGASVIPVLLPDAPSKPELPLFLRGLTWVDFRATEPDPMRQLIWGITGERLAD